jgi:hypothetical protein
LHGHDHEDAASPLDLFEQPATRSFSSMLDRTGRIYGGRTISN